MPNAKTYRYFTPEQIDQIPGINEPMIAPWLIPKGYVQEYNTTLNSWRVRKQSGNYPNHGYAPEDLFTFPEIAAKIYHINDNILP